MCLRIGVLNALFQDQLFEEGLDKAVAEGETAVEIGVGGGHVVRWEGG